MANIKATVTTEAATPAALRPFEQDAARGWPKIVKHVQTNGEARYLRLNRQRGGRIEFDVVDDGRSPAGRFILGSGVVDRETFNDWRIEPAD